MSKYCPVSCAEDFKKQGEAKMDLSCQDEHPQCEEWAKEGECESNVDMLKFCKKSCEACDGSKCRDGHKSCAFWAELGECESNPKVGNLCFILRSIVIDSLENKQQWYHDDVRSSVSSQLYFARC